MAMNERHDPSPSKPPDFRKRDRIETQIPRRRKAKALSPLESEWDVSQPAPPRRLRMSPSLQRLSGLPKQPTEVVDRLVPSVPDEAIAEPKK